MTDAKIIDLAGSDAHAWHRLSEAHQEALVPAATPGPIPRDKLKKSDDIQPYETVEDYFERVAA